MGAETSLSRTKVLTSTRRIQFGPDNYQMLPTTRIHKSTPPPAPRVSTVTE